MARSRQLHDDDDTENEELESYDEDEEESEEESEEPEKPAKQHKKKKSASARKQRRDESSNGLSTNKAAIGAMEQIAELTCHEALSTTAVEPTEEGWNVEVEVLEERRIPSTADILSLYAVGLNKHGDLLTYRRLKRYARNRSDGSGGC